MPGDICLRDDNVTHRCLTCAKNYRCELQNTNELLEMANYEPWVGEERTWYESEQPEADRANPFLEFDPQMCIICTRCVRACDEIRHTGAVTLAGRGFSTRIAFGSGGAIHDSNCDFCGACIDVCPTATLLEKPNKWIARTETWVSTTCNSCSVGCTLSMGVRNGRVVMVKPDRLNPVSWDQICVRGRFHYDAVKPRERLTRHLARQPGGTAMPSPYEAVLSHAAEELAGVIERHGPASVGVLVGPWATNEEAYLAQKLARAVIGTENVDSTAGPVSSAVSAALTDAFGTDVLLADMTALQSAQTIVVIADDLESSHNIAALRIKDAVVRSGASLVVISSRYGEVCDFIDPPPAGAIMPSPVRRAPGDQMGVWLRPAPGAEVATVAALGRFLAAGLSGVSGAATAASGPAESPGVSTEDMAKASSILQRAAHSDAPLAIVYAPNPASVSAAGEAARVVANLAILCRGDKAAESLFVMPVEANVHGIRDVGVVPGSGGLNSDRMLREAKALLVVGDNPAMFARSSDEVRAALEAMECVIAIDSVQSDTVKLSRFAFAALPAYARDGTFTSADRRVGRLNRAETHTGDQRDCLAILHELGGAVATRLGKQVTLPAADASAVMAEIAAEVPGYGGAAYERLESGVTRALPATPSRASVQTPTVTPAPSANGSFVLLTARTLYTSLDGAAMRSPEADKLHREEFLEINPADAIALGIGQNRPVIVQNGGREITLSAALTDAVAPGSVFLPLYYDGGIVNALVHADGAEYTTVSVRPA
jgi:predicted molibdopterin-dependent oxidoreductase YjgC